MLLKINFFTVIVSCWFASSAWAVQWKYLEDNDEVRIIAPAYGVADNLNKAPENIKNLGFNPLIPEDLIKTQPLGYANTIPYRVADLKSALNSDAKAIWTLRGGRGSSAVVQELEKTFVPTEQPKLFIGFSDATSIHLLLNEKYNWPSLHGVVLGYNKNANPLVNKETALDELSPILRGEIKTLIYKFTPLNKIKEETLEGNIIGGNASLVQRSIGTVIQPTTTGKFLFLEDVGEEPTRLFEVFTQFDRVGLLDKPRAVLLGNFSPKDETQKQDLKLVLQMFADKLQERGIPVLKSDLHGHGPRNLPLLFNTPASITLNNDEAEIRVSTNNPS